MAKLTATKVRAITQPGRYGDGGTLFLYVARGGPRVGCSAVTIDGKRRDIGLGGISRGQSGEGAAARVRESCCHRGRARPARREAKGSYSDIPPSRWTDI